MAVIGPTELAVQCDALLSDGAVRVAVLNKYNYHCLLSIKILDFFEIFRTLVPSDMQCNCAVSVQSLTQNCAVFVQPLAHNSAVSVQSLAQNCAVFAQPLAQDCVVSVQPLA